MLTMKKEMKTNPWTPGDTQSDIYENTEEKVMLVKNYSKGNQQIPWEPPAM